MQVLGVSGQPFSVRELCSKGGGGFGVEEGEVEGRGSGQHRVLNKAIESVFGPHVAD